MIIGDVIRLNGGKFYHCPLRFAHNELISTYSFNGSVICIDRSVMTLTKMYFIFTTLTA